MGLLSRRKAARSAAPPPVPVRERSAQAICLICNVDNGHDPDCPTVRGEDYPDPFAGEDANPVAENKPFPPRTVAHYPPNWRDEVMHRLAAAVPDEALLPAAAEMLALLDQWHSPGSKNPGNAYLDGIADGYGLMHAYLYGRAAGSDSDPARRVLIQCAEEAWQQNREYTAMRRRAYPHDQR